MPLELESLSQQIIGAAIDVHRELGPGLLESTYEACLMHALLARGLHAERQIEVPVLFMGHRIECGYRADVVVDRQILLELKSVEKLLPVHEAQLITYLRLGRYPVGLLINFNVTRLIDGIVRRANTSPPRITQ